MPTEAKYYIREVGTHKRVDQNLYTEAEVHQKLSKLNESKGEGDPDLEAVQLLTE